MKSVGGGVVGRQWVWLLDVERACGLVVGRCLEGMLLGPLLTSQEVRCKPWLTSHLLSCGLSKADCNPENVASTIECVVNMAELGPQVAIDSLHDLAQVYQQLSSPLVSVMSSESLILSWMSELARAEDWDSSEVTETDDSLLETTTRFLVATLFLHTGASQSQMGSMYSEVMMEIFRTVYRVRRGLLSLKTDNRQ